MTESDRLELLRVAEAILHERPLCDFCLGRQVAWLGTGTTNRERGHAIKMVLMMLADAAIRERKDEWGRGLVRTLAENGMFAPARALAEKYGIPFDSERTCWLCSVSGVPIFDSINRIVEDILLAVDGYEFDSFLVGSIPPPNLAEREDELRGQHGIVHGETIRSEINREIGRALQRRLSRPVDFESPQMVIVYDVAGHDVKLQVSPIFIYGRYKKLQRGIPQSRWDCPECRGKGCDSCGGTGRKYPDSIAEYIGVPAQRLAEGKRFKFHAAGREDIDVLMLGTGRPFVVEVSEPRVRSVDLAELQETINREAEGKVEVHDLRFTDRHHMHKLKEEASANIKEYSAVIETAEDVDDVAVRQAASALSGVTVEQQTPHRVLHRRSDRTREKHVYLVELKRCGPRTLEGIFRVQGGTYVKELISGDGGRTRPSLSELLGTECTCRELVVTAVYGD